MSTATKAEKDRYENSQPWRWLSKTVINANPICQAIDPGTGEQCHAPSCITHHLIAPEDCWEARNAWSNLTAVCRAHHSGGVKGDNLQWDYVPTRQPGIMGMPEVLHVHKTAEQLKCTTTTQPQHVWEALAAREREATREWEAWKAKRQSQATAAEQDNLSTEATDTQATTLT